MSDSVRARGSKNATPGASGSVEICAAVLVGRVDWLGGRMVKTAQSVRKARKGRVSLKICNDSGSTTRVGADAGLVPMRLSKVHQKKGSSAGATRLAERDRKRWRFAICGGMRRWLGPGSGRSGTLQIARLV